MIHVRQSRELAEVVFEVQGLLDVPSARELVQLSAAQPAGAGVVIDISRASSIQGLALRELLGALPAERARAIRDCSCGSSGHGARTANPRERGQRICDCLAREAAPSLLAQSA